MPELKQYQRDGIDFLREHQRAYLGDEAGLGKTAQLLQAAQGDTLIVGPAMVRDAGVYDHELELWAPELDATVVSYHDLHVKGERGRIPRDRRGEPTGQPRADLDRHWGTLIFDEAHYLKGRKTTWTVAADKLVKQADHVYFASGTPIPNWAYELWTVIRMLHPGDARFRSYWRWVEEWFVVGRNRFTAYDISGDLLACTDRHGLLRPECADRPAHDPCQHWHEFYTVNFGDMFLQRLRDDVLTELPPLTESVYWCPMGPEQRKVYKQLKKDYLAEVAETGTTHYAWSDASKYVKLMQCTTGLPVLDPAARKGSSKLDALRDLLPGRRHPVLLLAYYQPTGRALARLCDELGLKHATVGGKTSRGQRRELVQSFQRGELDVMIGSIEVIAEGLTLTRADTTIFVERHWRPSRNEQARRRVHRLGQSRPVTSIELRVPDSLDDGMTRLLDGKTDHQARALTPARVLAMA